MITVWAAGTHRVHIRINLARLFWRIRAPGTAAFEFRVGAPTTGHSLPHLSRLSPIGAASMRVACGSRSMRVCQSWHYEFALRELAGDVAVRIRRNSDPAPFARRTRWLVGEKRLCRNATSAVAILNDASYVNHMIRRATPDRPSIELACAPLLAATAAPGPRDMNQSTNSPRPSLISPASRSTR